MQSSRHTPCAVHLKCKADGTRSVPATFRSTFKLTHKGRAQAKPDGRYKLSVNLNNGKLLKLNSPVV